MSTYREGQVIAGRGDLQMPKQGTFRHTATAPTEWGSLVTQADKADPADTAAVKELVIAAAAIPLEQFERARYFGLGRAARELAGGVVANYATIIAKGIHAQTQYHIRYSDVARLDPDRGLSTLSIDGAIQGKGVEPIAQEAVQRLPLAERFALGALTLLAASRLGEIGGWNGSWCEANTQDLIEGKHVAGLLARTIFAGSAALIAEEICLQAQAMGAKPVKGHDDEYWLNSVIGQNCTSTEHLIAPATIVAKLRIDEFGDMGEHITLKSGRLIADRSRIPQAPPRSVKHTRSLHASRIGCPVIFVPGSIANSLALSNEIIMGAHRATTKKGRVRIFLYDLPRPWKRKKPI